MCEFCSFGPNSKNQDRDSSNPVFSGFFSADAIEAAVRQATQEQEQKRRQRKAEKQQEIDNNNGLRNSGELSLPDSDGSGQFDEDEVIDEDDDGT